MRQPDPMRTALSASFLASLFLVTACAGKAQGDQAQEQAQGAPETKHDEGDMKHGHGEGHGHHAHGEGHGDNGHGYKGHRFENPADWTEHFESAERTAWQKPDEVVAALGLRPDAIIADVGAGTGYFAVRLAAAAPKGKVFAVDIEPGMVEWLGKRAKEQGLSNMIAVQGKSDSPALPEAVDVVFMCNVIHHIEDPTAYFAGVAGSLRPGGKVVIVDFRKDNPDDAPGPPAAMRMSVEQISGIMSAAGYHLAAENQDLLQYQVMLTYARD